MRSLRGRWSPWLVPWFLLVAGCAGAMHGRQGGDGRDDAAAGWTALSEGNPKMAAERFARALAHDPSDARALFGEANLARESGAPEKALARSVALLEIASRGKDEIARGLAAATLSRVPRALVEVADRRAVEDRLLALDPRQLSWQAQYGLALVGVEIARTRADQALLDEVASRAGCVDAIDYVGKGGRLPLMDIGDAAPVVAVPPRRLLDEGCQYQLNTEDGRMGVKILRAEVELSAGRHTFVLDYAGPARLRVDSGPWHQHGDSFDVDGPRWSATSVQVAGGKHKVEVRIGMFGASAQLALLTMPETRPCTGITAKGEGDAAMMDLASALEANLVGDSDQVLERIARLTARPRFALGLVAAGRLGIMDATRPVDVTRDEARALWQQALAVDPGMARAWLDLSDLELRRGRPREAATHAERAREVAPHWWPADLALATALQANGLEKPADDARAAGLGQVQDGRGGCPMIENGLSRAIDLAQMETAGRLVEALGRCDAQSPQPWTWEQDHGNLDGAIARIRRALPTSDEPLWLGSDLAELWLANDQPLRGVEQLAEIVKQSPRDARAWIRLADAQMAQGGDEQRRATLAEALARFPVRSDVLRAARLAGLKLPLDVFRLDGGKVVAAYLASGRRYQAPAVVVLDRAVERAFADGSRLMLTHSISQVLSKDAIERIGEVQVPPGAQILALRTRKADGTLREAEEIAGKPTVSAPNLAVGDFVEMETLESKQPKEAFAPGFVGERFYFRSFDAPLDRSEYIFVAPAGTTLNVDRRAGGPTSSETRGSDGSRILTFVARQQPQVFPERSAVPPVEWIPSVRVWSGVDLEAWSRFVAESLARSQRGSVRIRKLASDIERQAGSDRGGLAQAIAAWVADHIEPENDITEPATVTLARGRGNRAGLMVALARSLKVPVDLVLARSRLAADADEPISPAELDDFREVLVRFPSPQGSRFVDPRLRRAPFGYVTQALDGAPAVVTGGKELVKVRSTVEDTRKVELQVRLAIDGSASVTAREVVTGWPAIEWREMLDRVGKDRSKLRQGFEQHWLGHQFPGARLDALKVELGADGASVRLVYSFEVDRFAERLDGVLRFRPVFFRTRPGRRYGNEPERKTTLAIGPDVSLDLEAEIRLPTGAKPIDLGGSGAVNAGGARFREERRATEKGGIPVIQIHRASRLPILRVTPADYQHVAALLRGVDPLEDAEIRVSLPGK